MPRPALLVVNPNTTQSITTLLCHHVAATTGDAVAVHGTTARHGAPYIADEASYAVGATAAVDAWTDWRADAAAPAVGAVLIGCFGDPGLAELRSSAGLPVTGLAEAAFAEAAAHGRFAVVTGGERWKPMLERLARQLGHGDALAAVHTVAPSGAELAADPDHALRLLARACEHVAALPGVRAVILGGAGLAGLAARIQPDIGPPLIDSVQAGARRALALLHAADDVQLLAPPGREPS